MKADYIFKQRKENVYIFPSIFVIGHVLAKGLRKILNGKDFGNTMCIWKENVMYWYASDSKAKAAGLELFNKITKNPNLVKQSMGRFQKKAKPFLVWVKKNSEKDFSHVSNFELNNFWDEYLKRYESAYLDSEPLVICMEEYFSGYLADYIKEKNNGQGDASAIYNILVSPQEKSFVKREEDDLLGLALKIKEGKIKDKEASIAKHEAKYYWVPFDYGMYLWDKKYFKEILRGMLKHSAGELRNKILNSRKYLKKLPLEQAIWEKKLNIDKRHKQYFSVMRQAGYLLDYKKEIFTQIHFFAQRILRETGKRLGVKRESVQYYLPKEMRLALTKNKILDRDILEARGRHSYVRWYDDEIEAITENPDKLMGKYLLKEERVTGKFDGIIASAGRYIGKVKVLHSANEINKVEQGDILVASMTSPDYVPAMRRAGAIITDEGGVMCHAAIVSRELGIPCVVGTKNATKFLHDGDEVEVNANHNSVRIIRK